jgi:hypothetical protein
MPWGDLNCHQTMTAIGDQCTGCTLARWETKQRDAVEHCAPHLSSAVAADEQAPPEATTDPPESFRHDITAVDNPQGVLELTKHRLADVEGRLDLAYWSSEHSAEASASAIMEGENSSL